MAKEMNFLFSFSSQLDLLEAEGKHMEMSNEILKTMMKNVDLSPLAGKIIKFLAVPYPPCKKVMYAFLTRYSTSIADLNILATNSLLKDFQDPNPYIRRLVIKTVCSIPCLSELALELLPQALCDSSWYVRCATASTSTLLVNETNIKDNQDIIDRLYEMIRDPDPSVICSSLSALNEILASDGGVVINSKITCYLIKRIHDFQGWNFTVIYTVLKKYVPKNSEEMLSSLNALDQKLHDADPAVFLLAADLILYYISQKKKDFSGDVIAEISPRLKRLLNCSSAEVLTAVLDIIGTYLPEHSAVFALFHKMFFCRFSDTAFVKVKKLKIVVSLMNASNILDIAEELLVHCCDASKDVSSQAIHSFTEVIRKHSQLNELMGTFVSLMDIQFNNLSEEILNALSAVDLTQSPDIKECVLSTVSKYSQSMKNAESKLSLLKFVGNYGKDIHNAPYIVECYVNEEENFENERLASFLLTTSVELFLIRPEEMQLLLGRVLQKAQKSSCLLLQKQAVIYCHLLKDLDLSMKVIPVDCKSLTSIGAAN